MSPLSPRRRRRALLVALTVASGVLVVLLSAMRSQAALRTYCVAGVACDGSTTLALQQAQTFDPVLATLIVSLVTAIVAPALTVIGFWFNWKKDERERKWAKEDLKAGIAEIKTVTADASTSAKEAAKDAKDAATQSVEHTRQAATLALNTQSSVEAVQAALVQNSVDTKVGVVASKDALNAANHMNDKIAAQGAQVASLINLLSDVQRRLVEMEERDKAAAAQAAQADKVPGAEPKVG